MTGIPGDRLGLRVASATPFSPLILSLSKEREKAGDEGWRRGRSVLNQPLIRPSATPRRRKAPPESLKGRRANRLRSG